MLAEDEIEAVRIVEKIQRLLSPRGAESCATRRHRQLGGEGGPHRLVSAFQGLDSARQ